MLRGAGRGAAAVALMALAQVVAAPQAKTPEERARESVAWVVAGNYESLYETFTPEMQKALPVEALRAKWDPA